MSKKANLRIATILSISTDQAGRFYRAIQENFDGQAPTPDEIAAYMEQAFARLKDPKEVARAMAKSGHAPNAQMVEKPPKPLKPPKPYGTRSRRPQDARV